MENLLFLQIYNKYKTITIFEARGILLRQYLKGNSFTSKGYFCKWKIVNSKRLGMKKITETGKSQFDSLSL